MWLEEEIFGSRSLEGGLWKQVFGRKVDRLKGGVVSAAERRDTYAETAERENFKSELT
jgi:hypothetical protein